MIFLSLSACEGTIIETKGSFLSFSQAAAALVAPEFLWGAIGLAEL